MSMTACSISVTAPARAMPRTRGSRVRAAAPAWTASSVNARTASLRLAAPAYSRADARKQVVSMSLFGLGGPELLVIGVVAAVVFGPQKIAAQLPGLGREAGKTVKSLKEAADEFKEEMNNAATEAGKEFKAELDEKETKAAAEKPAEPKRD